MSGERKKNISISFYKDDFSILVENNIAHISTAKFLCSYGNDLSCPALPKVCVNILIGPDEELLDFSYKKTEQKILDNILIAPCPEILPTNSPVKDRINTDTLVWYTQDIYPQTFVDYLGSYTINGYKILSFDICPFRYDNLSRVLYLEQNFTFDISLKTTTSKRNVKIRQNDEAIIRNLVVNTEDICLYKKFIILTKQGLQTTPLYEYAIITNNELKPTFQKLANWKTLKGVRTIVLAVEDIYAAYPDTISQHMKIKEALKSLYENNTPNFKYVLLAGDVDVIPAQMCYVKFVNRDTYSTFTPTDLFYANFNTMDWDANGNGIFGELSDSIKLSQDIAITRAPVSTIADAEVFVNRIISYESAHNIQTWSNNILLCGCRNYNSYEINGVIMSDAHVQGKRLYDCYMRPYFGADSIRKVEFYDTGTDLPGGANYDFIASNIQKELSKGYTFVCEDSHGEPLEWSSTEGADYSVSYADTLNNSNHTIIVTSACLTNAFDSTYRCLSEAFIRNPNSGVVAYFGCSRSGWSGGGKNQFGDSNAINGLLYKNIILDPNKNYGEIVRQVKNSIVTGSNTYNITYRWLLFGLNPIGDPEMPIFTKRPKKFMNVSISFSDGDLYINTGEDNCKICVASTNDNGASFYDVSTGNSASFSNLNDDYSICITKQGYVPYIARCGNTVYIQNESINTDYEVISNQTNVGSNVTPDKPNGSVEINKGNTIIKSTNGIIIHDSFEVKKGASLEIRTN